jgi:acetyl-CoA carboxylase carboxyl transferase subunit alpha
MASRLKQYLIRQIGELMEMPKDELLAARYEKFRRMGVFLDSAESSAE